MPTEREKELLVKSRINLTQWMVDEQRRLVIEDKITDSNARRVTAAVIAGMGKAIQNSAVAMKDINHLTGDKNGTTKH